MADETSKPDERGLSKAPAAPDQGLTMEQVLSHPAVVKMTQEFEQMRQMVQGLPEAIGRAVSAAMKQPPQGASGPAVPLKAGVKATRDGSDVEFHRGGRILQGGAEVAKGEALKSLPRLIAKKGPRLGGECPTRT